jgi:hypothetical protein
MNFSKARNIFEFFKSTLVINLAFCVFPILFLGFFAFKYTFLTVGFAVSLLVKEINTKNEYLFYYNNRISKIELWFYTWCFNFFAFIFISLAFNFINKLF